MSAIVRGFRLNDFLADADPIINRIIYKWVGVGAGARDVRRVCYYYGMVGYSGICVGGYQVSLFP